MKKKKNIEETEVVENNENEAILEEEVNETDKIVEELQNKLAEAENKALRANAELINYRKRKDEEVQRLLMYCNEGLIEELLPTIDNFERALSLDSSDTKLLDGMKMVYQALLNTLRKYGVEEIDALDKPFDPNLHQAVITDSIEDKDDDIVIEVMQKGYKLKDKVIRPAMVKVNKK